MGLHERLADGSHSEKINSTPPRDSQVACAPCSTCGSITYWLDCYRNPPHCTNCEPVVWGVCRVVVQTVPYGADGWAWESIWPDDRRTKPRDVESERRIEWDELPEWR